MSVEKSKFQWKIVRNSLLTMHKTKQCVFDGKKMNVDLWSLKCHLFICRFSTSRQTLTCIPDTFFTALLSGRISSLRDDSGAIFIDRDPTLFGIILNYLRTRDIDIKQCDLRILRHEAEYYNISPLVRRLILCEDLNHSSCGDVWFYAHLTPPGSF